MKDYWKEKLISEYATLKDIWSTLSADWKEKNENYENLYCFRVPLNMTAFLCRRLMEQTYIANKENKKYENKYKKIEVRILKDGFIGGDFYKDVKSMQYPDTFKNKIEAQEELYKICNYIIHENGSSYADDMISFGENGAKLKKSSEKTSFFYHVVTHKSREWANKDQLISWFMQWSSEKSGKVLIDIKSLMSAFEKFINLS